jgi:hypothetical protein
MNPLHTAGQLDDVADKKRLQRLHVLMLKPEVGEIEDALRDSAR